MQVRVITMKYNEGQQGFSEEALRSATFGRDVLACETHFFTHGGAPHLTLVLQLADASGFDAERSFKPRDPPAIEGNRWRSNRQQSTAIGIRKGAA